MKKIILPIIAATFIFASCDDTATTDKKVADAPKTEQTTPVKQETPAPVASNTGIPKFSTPEAQKFAEEYDAYIKNSIEAAKSGDQAKIAEFQKSAQDWSKKVMEFGSKLTPEDAIVWAEYIQKLAVEQQSVMTK